IHDGSVGRKQKEERLEDALVQLRNHRENLIEALNYFFSEERSGPLLERREGIQVLRPDGSYLLPERVLVNGPEGREEKEVFRDTTVGIVVGMVLGSGKVSDDLPLVSMMRSDGKVKVSARGNRGMIARGLDLSSAMRDAAASVGGTGGGHDIAAGATVPEPRVKDFLAALDGKVAAQLRTRPGRIT
ncbi:MAG: DHH family phosphoesterase, partial [Methanomassiliicoccales archaeon]|nr:DHH family phosphoesterase [Methanomassiliicoccales archaeon]